MSLSSFLGPVLSNRYGQIFGIRDQVHRARQIMVDFLNIPLSGSYVIVSYYSLNRFGRDFMGVSKQSLILM